MNTVPTGSGSGSATLQKIPFDPDLAFYKF
jgi:hypothetical protein